MDDTENVGLGGSETAQWEPVPALQAGDTEWEEPASCAEWSSDLHTTSTRAPAAPHHPHKTLKGFQMWNL